MKRLIATITLTLALGISFAATNAQAQDGLDSGLSAEVIDAGKAAPIEASAEPSPEAPEINTGLADVDAGEAISGLTGAVQAGKWLVALGFGLLLLSAFARKLVGFIDEAWAKSKTGGKVIGGAVGFTGALGVSLSLGQSWSFDLAMFSIVMAGVGAGFWSLGPDKLKAFSR